MSKFNPASSSTRSVNEEELLDNDWHAELQPLSSLSGGIDGKGDGPSSPRQGVRIPGVTLERPAGRGGSSVVFLGRLHDEHQTPVAVKLLSDATFDREGLVRFNREVQSLNKLQHPFIAKLLQSGITENFQPYLILEFVDGQRIDKFCQLRRLDLRERLRLMLDVCEAVEYAHQQGILHRDLKPSNVLVGDDGIPRLTDFGLAKLMEPSEGDDDYTRTGAVLGTLNYLAPEQMFDNRQQLSPATDVFGLGALLHVLLTDQSPFQFGSIVEAARDYFKRLPTSIGKEHLVPAEIEAVCVKCLAPHPDNRYQSAAALKQDLHRFLVGDAISTKTWKLGRKWSNLRLQYPWLLPALVLSLVLMASASIVFFYLWRSSAVSLQKADVTIAQLKDTMIELADVVRAQEGSPATIQNRRDQLVIISQNYQKLDAELFRDLELLFAAAVNDFKLGQLEHLLGNDVSERQAKTRANAMFRRLVEYQPDHEEGRFGLFHSMMSLGETAEALPIIESLVEDYPDSIDYGEALASTLIDFATRDIGELEAEQARTLIERAVGELKELEAAGLPPDRFHRKMKTAFYRLSRIGLLDQDLNEAQLLISRAMDHARQFDPLESSVASETREVLAVFRLAFSLAAFEGDAETAERIRLEADALYERAKSEYPSFVELHRIRSSLLAEYAAFYWSQRDQSELASIRILWRDNLVNWQAQATLDGDFWAERLRFSCCPFFDEVDVDQVEASISALVSNPDWFRSVPRSRLAAGYLSLGNLEAARQVLVSVDGEEDIEMAIHSELFESVARGKKLDPVPTPTRAEQLHRLGVSASYSAALINERVQLLQQRWLNQQ